MSESVQLAEFRGYIESLIVNSEDDYRAAGAMLAHQIKPMIENIKSETQPAIDAAKMSLSEARKMQKKFLKPVDELAAKIKQILSSFENRREADMKEEVTQHEAAISERTESIHIEAVKGLLKEGKTQEAISLAEERNPTPVLPTPQLSRIETSDLRRGKLWKWKLFDATKVKREWWIIDEKSINKAVREHQLDAEEMVGGIKAYSVYSIT